VVIGKDTRLSGYMMESAMVAGFTSVGMDVVLLGPMPTPAVAMLTRSMRADIGVMISASHNPFADNGIKLFGPDGYKLSDEVEQAIEGAHGAGAQARQVRADRSGPADRRCERPLCPVRQGHLPRAAAPRRAQGGGRLRQWRLPTTSRPRRCGSLAPRWWRSEVAPNGLNINDGCGSTHPELLQQTVVESGADIGLALDGDADRLIVADEKGQLVDGDQLMALIALGLQARGELLGDAVIATVMSNLGLERRLREAGIGLVRTKVGDRYVLEEMRRSGCNVGGEQSGHIILTDHATTGDGLVAGLQVLAALVEAKAPASELLRQFEPLPQLLKNVRFNGGTEPLEADSVRKRIAAAESELEGRGRLVIRKSGTEPLIRVMAEGDDPALVARLVDDICQAVQSAA
jgi:phosphoglucosamine mutase